MPIQYRCRCGQEVVLRPREFVYVALAAMFGLTLANTLLLVFLWHRTGETPIAPARGELAAAPPAPAERTAPTANAAGDEASTPLAASDAPAFDNTHVAVSDVSETALATAAASRGDGVPQPAVESSNPASPDAESSDTESSAAVLERIPRVLQLEPPAGLTGLAVRLLLDSEAALDQGDRALVLMAATRWTCRPLRDSARRALVVDPLFAELDRALADAETRAPSAAAGGATLGGGATLALALDGLSPPLADLLLSLESDWEKRWRSLIGLEKTGREIRAWSSAAARASAEPADYLVLIDLSESMVGETAACAAFLREIVPLLCDARATQRWGWVGYRDTVVDRFDLTADGDAFIESLSRWHCEGGGDVPEGVDEAVFEALRFGATAWSPPAEHRMIIVGDAPPPRERIAPLVALIEGARSSPERYRVDCLGITREPELPFVPGFADMARVGGGVVRLVPAGTTLDSTLWDLLTCQTCSWTAGPLAQ